MAAAATAQFGQHAEIGPLLPLMQSEVTILWHEIGVTNRCRPDFYLGECFSGSSLTPTIVHYKTTATRLNPAALPRFAAGQGWDLTAAHYAAGVKALTGTAPRQYFAIQENTPPYLGQVVELDPIFLACGEMCRELALGIWAKCLRENVWPGYPSGTLRLECPPWHESMMTSWKDFGARRRRDETIRHGSDHARGARCICQARRRPTGLKTNTRSGIRQPIQKGTDTMKIIRFEAEHVKKIQAVQITPTGHVVEIAGKNGAGKTSILDSIWWALAGTRSHQPEPIHRDHTKARIKLDLGELTVEREFKRLPAAPGKQDERFTTRIHVTTKEGVAVSSPQTMLDQLLGSLSFDPLAFARKSEAEQYRTIQEICGVDLQDSDRQNEADFGERRVVNRTAKARREAADQIHVPTERPMRIDVAALIQERQRREMLNVKRAAIVNGRESFESQIVTAENDAERLETSITIMQEDLARHDAQFTENVDRVRAEAKRQIDALTSDSIASKGRLFQQRKQYETSIKFCAARANNAKTELQALPATPIPETFTDIDEQTERAESVNATVNEAERQVDLKDRLTDEASAAEAESRRLTEAMASRKLAATAAVEKASLNIPGLSLDNGQVNLNGLPFAQASDADQLRASCAIAMNGDQELKVIRVRDGSLLDEDSMQILAEMAKDADYQVWVERVSTRPGRWASSSRTGA